MIEFGSSQVLAAPFPELVKGQQSGKDEYTKVARLVGKPNPNVILLSFNKLGDDIDVVTGDPVVCSKCSAILNKSSNFKLAKESNIFC